MEETAVAMVFEKEASPFVVQEFYLPDLSEGEVLVKTEFATICTSDLHTFYGRRTSHCHSILGHEIIGHVDKIAANGVKDFTGNLLKEGDRVTWAVYAHDAESKMSKKGFPQKSENLYKYGHQKIDGNCQLNGGFASHCHLLKGSSIFKIPETLSAEEAAPLNCTHATTAGAIRLAGDLKGKTVLVSGAGMLGLSACAMAKENGANAVLVNDIQETRMEMALSFGTDFLLNENEFTTTKHKKFKGEIDIIIETSGQPNAIENTLEKLTTGGIIILVGAVFPQRNISINAEKIVRKLLTIKGLHNYIPDDLKQAIQFLQDAKDKYPFKKLVGKTFPLNQLDAAFAEGNIGKHYRIGIETKSLITNK
ncbi:zinc-binding dehydrogenase [Chondrinema litorale]|uniref:zinc-binding dehydrogenase n=1 Tax=Chondrinema litorale TaxID=2994555 RepID=UPI002542F411|nr:zinc-binding dehydrogenase [Chondrinema litorale]UZR97492.1 zinc-binding dehydrogenase [Chondrinema litorale]